MRPSDEIWKCLLYKNSLIEFYIEHWLEECKYSNNWRFMRFVIDVTHEEL